MEFNKEQLLNLYDREANITKAAKAYCEANKIPYDDAIRRSASRVINSFSVEGTQEVSKPAHNAKIYVFDIETSFIEYRGFSLYPTSIPHENITKDWFILSFSYKELFKDEITSFGVTPEEALNGDDKRIVKELWKMFDEADIVIAWNGQKFDVKKANARFFKHDLLLPSPFRIIDPLLSARKTFALTSNRLDFVSNFLGFEGKLENPKGLWHLVMGGDPNAMEQMIAYNEVDVKILEEVYLKMRPYMRGHVNLGVYVTENINSCPTCGSSDVHHHADKMYTTQSNQYPALSCGGCGSWFRGKTSLLKPKDRSELTLPLPNN